MRKKKNTRVVQSNQLGDEVVYAGGRGGLPIRDKGPFMGDGLGDKVKELGVVAR